MSWSLKEAKEYIDRVKEKGKQLVKKIVDIKSQVKAASGGSLGLSLNADIDAAIKVILDDSFLKVIDRTVFALDNVIDKTSEELQELVQQVFNGLSDLEAKIERLTDKFFQNLSVLIKDIKTNLVDPIVKAVFDLEGKIFQDIDKLLDKLFNFFSGTIQEFKDYLLQVLNPIPNPFDPCRQQLGLATTPGLKMTHVDLYNLFECQQLLRLEDSATKVKEIQEIYATLQLESFKMTCLGRGSPNFQQLYMRKWLEYGQLFEIWKEFNDSMTAQQAFDEAIRRLDQARNEYQDKVDEIDALTTAVNSARVISGRIAKSYFQTGHPLETGTPVGERSDSVRVDFPSGRFADTPIVQVSLYALDTSQATNLRVDVSPVDISASGFSIKISTRSNSIVYGVGVAWIAYAS
jgi:hypothetical protein